MEKHLLIKYACAARYGRDSKWTERLSTKKHISTVPKTPILPYIDHYDSAKVRRAQIQYVRFVDLDELYNFEKTLIGQICLCGEKSPDYYLRSKRDWYTFIKELL